MKIGKFGYVNSYLPYYWIEKHKMAEVVETSPKEMINLLETKMLDYAPIPSFYYLKNKHRLNRYTFCIASDGKVYSVIVVSKSGDLSRIAITNETTTSVNLLRILLAEKNLNCKLIPINASSAEELLKHCDSALVIGDEAIKARKKFRVVMDLGEEWKDLTGYPMVFGISASLCNAKECDNLLMKSIDWGLKNFDEVVQSAVERFKLSEDFLRKYFKALIYKVDTKVEKGLKVFEELCKDHGLL